MQMQFTFHHHSHSAGIMEAYSGLDSSHCWIQAGGIIANLRQSSPDTSVPF
jgi:NADH:ubiquinone oxidoreductase subunit D